MGETVSGSRRKAQTSFRGHGVDRPNHAMQHKKSFVENPGVTLAASRCLERHTDYRDTQGPRKITMCQRMLFY